MVDAVSAPGRLEDESVLRQCLPWCEKRPLVSAYARNAHASVVSSTGYLYWNAEAGGNKPTDKPFRCREEPSRPERRSSHVQLVGESQIGCARHSKNRGGEVASASLGRSRSEETHVAEIVRTR